MQKWESKTGTSIFKVLAGRSNSYLIHTKKGNLLVDTGPTSSFRNLLCNLQKYGLQLQNIDFLLLTHSHFDHCQNAHLIREQSKCKICASKYETDFMKHGYTPLPKGTFLYTRLLSNIGNKIGPKRFGYMPFTPDINVSEQSDPENYPIKIIATPGHSEGSISVIVDNEIAIVGDTLFGVFKNSVFPPFADDTSELIKSWKKLLSTQCHTFLPGHGSEISRDLLQKEFIKHSGKIDI
jgi:hydroxyacylglutathione hydrolase